jgi:leucine dehydrogenase
VVTDVDEARVRLVLDRHSGGRVRAVAPEAILDQDVDVFAPFAFGGVIDAAALDRLRVRVIAGSANNVMADDAVEREVVARGIVYAVDFIANAGGAIMDADHLQPGGIDPSRVARKLAAIGPRIAGVLDLADREGILPSEAAERLARRRLAAAACRSEATAPS